MGSICDKLKYQLWEGYTGSPGCEGKSPFLFHCPYVPNDSLQTAQVPSLQACHFRPASNSPGPHNANAFLSASKPATLLLSCALAPPYNSTY